MERTEETTPDRKSYVLRAFLAFPAGAAAFIAACALAFVYLSHTSAEEFWQGFAALILASVVGAVVTALVSPNPWPRALYLFLGALAFFGLAVLIAAMSDGHPDNRYFWLSPGHALASSLVFIILPRSNKHLIWRRINLTIALLTAGLVGYGYMRDENESRQLVKIAAMDQRAAIQLWLPMIFTKPPSVIWDTPTFRDHAYNVDGQLERRNRAIDLEGQVLFSSCRFGMPQAAAFQEAAPHETHQHYVHRLADYLQKLGCRKELVAGLTPSPRTGLMMYEFHNVQRDPADPSKGTHNVTVFISVYQDTVAFEVSYSNVVPHLD